METHTNQSSQTVSENAITLPSGKVATIAVGKGKHSNQALKMADNDSSKYLAALMSLLVTIDGQAMVPEELEELSLKDYAALQTAFSNQNF